MKKYIFRKSKWKEDRSNNEWRDYMPFDIGKALGVKK